MLKKIGLAVLILVVLLITYNLINQIADAIKSGDRLSQEAENLYKLQSENKKLKNRLSEIKSPQYIEEQARNKLGLVKKGETVVIIPEEKLKQVLGASESAQEVKYPNWLGWIKVFFK